MPRVFKLKKVSELPDAPQVLEVPEAPQVPEVLEAPQVPEAPKKKVIKLKKVVPVQHVPKASEVSVIQELSEVPQEAPKKKVLKLKKNLLPTPPIPPPTAHLTKTMEAFEAIREYYATIGQEPTQSDIAWYHAELEAEKKELDTFWSENKVVKIVLEAICRGATEEELNEIETAASRGVAPRPPTEADLGPMPAHGTGEFWAWCAKRKRIRLAKEAAIIAAGGTVPPPKVKKVKAKPKPQA
jgi:hypothetical protein